MSKVIPIANLVIPAKYLPFVPVSEDGKGFIKSKGYLNGKVTLVFSEGLTGLFIFEPDNNALAEALKNKGTIFINVETGVGEEFHYDDSKDEEKAKSSSTGSMRERG